jgi:hypothetical protein
MKVIKCCFCNEKIVNPIVGITHDKTHKSLCITCVAGSLASYLIGISQNAHIHTKVEQGGGK